MLYTIAHYRDFPDSIQCRSVSDSKSEDLFLWNVSFNPPDKVEKSPVTGRRGSERLERSEGLIHFCRVKLNYRALPFYQYH